jgi:ubiquinol-cytochrome c reductase cytochrome c1 subunit
MVSARKVFVCAFALCAWVVSAAAEGVDAPALPVQAWSFSGAFGAFDKASARRGFQVYSESCANCHAMSLLHYRDLSGIGFTEDQIKAVVANISVPAGVNSEGKPLTKPATAASQFHAPFPDEESARAALNGALAPDLSLSVSASAGGADYIYAVLTGYGDAPKDVKLADGMSYNKYFPGHQIAMPQPLSDGQVTYNDGTPSTVAQNAHDLVTFLSFAANPEMDQRKRIGLFAAAYCLIMAGVTFALKRRIWAKVH